MAGELHTHNCWLGKGIPPSHLLIWPYTCLIFQLLYITFCSFNWQLVESVITLLYANYTRTFYPLANNEVCVRVIVNVKFLFYFRTLLGLFPLFLILYRTSSLHHRHCSTVCGGTRWKIILPVSPAREKWVLPLERKRLFCFSLSIHLLSHVYFSPMFPSFGVVAKV